jgi:hypothetical protein
MKKSRANNNNKTTNLKENQQTNGSFFDFSKLNIKRILICWFLSQITLVALVMFNLVVRNTKNSIKNTKFSNKLFLYIL